MSQLGRLVAKTMNHFSAGNNPPANPCAQCKKHHIRGIFCGAGSKFSPRSSIRIILKGTVAIEFL